MDRRLRAPLATAMAATLALTSAGSLSAQPAEMAEPDPENQPTISGRVAGALDELSARIAGRRPEAAAATSSRSSRASRVFAALGRGEPREVGRGVDVGHHALDRDLEHLVRPCPDEPAEPVITLEIVDP
jgi:hypothetical protein